MTDIKTWLKSQRELLAAATPGPWKFIPASESDDWQIYNSEFTFVKQDDSGVPVSTDDGKFIASVRTEHERALKIIEKYREALELYKYTTMIKVVDFNEVNTWPALEALNYFPEES